MSARNFRIHRGALVTDNRLTTDDQQPTTNNNTKKDFNAYRSILELARTEFCPRPRLLRNRDSKLAGGQKRFRSEDSKLPKNLKTNRLELYFGRAKEIFS